MFVMICGAFVIVCLVFHLIGSKLNDIEATIHAEKKAADKDYQIKKRKKEGDFTFTRLNGVEGYIKVNGRRYNTYNSGSLTFGDEQRNVQIDIWVRHDGCFLEDIYICGFSTQDQLPYGLTSEQSIDYMLGLVDKAVGEGIIPRHVEQATKRTVNDFFNFGDLLDNGTIAELPGTADYVWMGDIEARD